MSAITLTSALPAMTESQSVILAFLATAVLLDFFDISLPRGDSVGVGGALLASSILILGPGVTLAMAVVSAVIAHILRHRFGAFMRLAAVLLSRTIAIVAATGVLLVLPSGWLAEPMQPTRLLVVSVLVSAAFLIVEIAVAQAAVAVSTSRPYVRLMRGNLRSQAPMLLAQWSASVLLLLTFDVMQGWALVPFAALLLLMRQSYALFLDIRETYRTTVEVLVEAAESQDARKMGHADRCAMAARAIAMRIGLNASAVERISYAALLHDIAELSEAPEVEGIEGRRVNSADVVRDVEFFSAVEPILRVCDGDTDHPVSEDDLVAALIVALASDIDAGDHPEIRESRHSSSLELVAARVPVTSKAQVVSAAIQLGYRIPAVG